MATDSLGLPPGFELEDEGSTGLPPGFSFESDPGPANAELPQGFEIEAGGRNPSPMLNSADNPPYKPDSFVAEKQTVNGVEYRRHGPTGTIYDPNGRATDDPEVLKAFGKAKPTKIAQRIVNAQREADRANQPGVLDYGAEFGKAAVRGVSSTANSTARGIGVLTSDNPTEIDKVEESLRNLKTMSPEQATDFMRSLPSRLSPAVALNYQMAIRKLWNGDAAAAQPYLDQARKYTDTRPVEEQELSTAGQNLEDATNAAFPQDPRFKGSITSDLGQALGSSAFFLPIGLLSGGTGVAVAGAAAGADQSYQQAKQDIGTSRREDRAGLWNSGLGTAADTEALAAGRLGALPGASEVVPTEVFLEQMPKYIPGLRTIANTPVWGRFAKSFGRIGTQVLSEGGQEAFQQWASNVINKLKINPDQDVTEDVLYNALLGGAVGGGMQVGVEGYNAAFGKDEAAPQPAPPAAPGAPPPAAGSPRIEPRLFRDQAAPVPPGFDVEQPEAPVSDDAYLVGAGYTPEQIYDMNPDEHAAAAEEARQQGVEPVELMAGAPAPGTAPMAPRATAASDQPEEINMPPGEPPPPPGAAPMAPRGTRRDKVNVQSDQDLDAVRPTVNAAPSEAQAKAGNYQKGHIKIQGLDVSIENPRGSTRRGTDEDGTAWQSPDLPADYGYIKGTTGKDGDHVDVYIGPNPQSDRVFVIDQHDLKTGKFDEHKSVLGADTIGEAVDLYVNSFDNPTLDRIGDVTEMSVDEFKQWVKDGRSMKRPASKAGVGTVTPNTPEVASADDFDTIFQQELDQEFGAKPQPEERGPGVDTARADADLSKFLATRKPLTPAAFAQHAGIDEADAGRALQRAALAGRITQGRNGQWRRNPVRSTPINALDFIASIGGIQDPTGELGGMDLPKMTPFGPVIRKSGLHPDKVREALVERGYLHDRGFGTDRQGETTVADVYDLIARHMSGKKAYSVQDQAKADELAATRRAETMTPDDWESTHPIAQRWGEDVWHQIQQALTDMGLEEEAWSPQEVNDAARMVAEGMDAGSAFERAAFMHLEELDQMEEVAPEIAAAFEKNRANAMVAMEVPPFPDVEPQTDAVQQQGSPEASDGIRENGEASDVGSSEAEVPGAGAEVRGSSEAGTEGRGEEPAVNEGVGRPRRNAIGSHALEDALTLEAQAKLEEWFKRRNASRDLRHIREAMEVYQRAIDGRLYSEAEAVRSAMEVFLEDPSAETAADLDAATYAGLQAVTGERDPDPAELLENEVFASAEDAGRLIFQTLDPKTAAFDDEEFNIAFGDVEFRRDQQNVFPPVKNQVRVWKDAGLNRIPQEDADARIQQWKDHAQRIGREEDHSNEVILSLFDVTGQWSQPYRDAGYHVIQYDIKSGNDLMKFGDWMMDVEEQISEGREIVGILAAPPCTTYASSGARWWSEIHDKKDRAAIEKTFGKVWAADFFESPVDYANALVAVVKLIVEQADPKFYAMENPVGRIQSQNQLPDALLSFDPSNFGNPYTKRTLLWGEFDTDLPTANVEPTLGSLIHKLRGDDPKQKAQRSETPDGFAYAFFMANNTSSLFLGAASSAALTEEQASGGGPAVNDESESAVAGQDGWLISSNEHGVFADADPVQTAKEKAGSASYTINVLEPRTGRFTASYRYDLQGQSGGSGPATTVEDRMFDSPEEALANAASSILPQFEYDFRSPDLPASKKRDAQRIILRLKEIGGRSRSEENAPVPSTEKGADNKQQTVLPGAEQDVKGAINNAAKAPLKPVSPQKGMNIGLFGSERDQSDLFDKPAPKKAPPEETAARAQQIRDKFVIFSSGMSRLKDFLSGAYTTGSLSTRGIGIDINEISDTQVKPMAEKIVQWQTQAFIDSGAFGVFKRNLKERVKYENALIDLFEAQGAEAPELEELSDQAVLDRYDEISMALGEASEREGEASYPQPLYVAPDIVGHQAGSLALVKKHAGWIKRRLEGGHNIIIPIQKGEKSLAEIYEAVAEILGRRDFIVGVPSNQKAVSDAEFAAFVKEAKPSKLHFLGTTDKAKIDPRIEAIATAGYVPDHVSSDANMLRALLYGRSDLAETRDQAIRRVIKEKSPEFGELAGSEPEDFFSLDALEELGVGSAESFDDVFKDELDAAFEEKPKAERTQGLQGNWWEPLMGGDSAPTTDPEIPEGFELSSVRKLSKKQAEGTVWKAGQFKAVIKRNVPFGTYDAVADTRAEAIAKALAAAKPKERGAGEAAVSAAKNTGKGMGEIVQGLEALFGSKNKLSSGFTFDEESYAKALPLFKAAVAHLGEAVSDMREVVRALIKKFREAGMSRDALENMGPYLKRFAEDVTAGKESLETAPSKAEQGPFHPLVVAFVDYLSQPDAGFDSITEARKFAADRGFNAKPGTPEAKDLDEKLELAIVLTARTLVAASKARPPKTAYRRLVDLYSRQPNLGVRTSESMADQAYSTPAPLAYIASRLAGVAGAKSVLEPTAGNGMLLIEAAPSKADVNELNDRRAAALRAQGFKVSQLDAASEKLRHAGYPVEAVIENPPFGAVKESDGSSKQFDVDGWNTTQIDHAIALNTLKSMAYDGRAVLIVGSVKEGTDKSRSDSYNTKQKREFYWRLYQGYNVTDHFTVAGDLYKRQGAGWPVDVIVIEGRGKSARPLPAVELPKVYDTWESLEEKLDEAPIKSQSAAGETVGGGAVSQPSNVRDGAEDGQRLEAGSRRDQSPDGGRGAAAAQPAADGEGAVPPGRDQRQLDGAGKQQSAEPDGGEVATGERGERGGDREPPVPGRERLKQDAEAAQQPYKPMSSQPTLDTKIPTNMADAVETSLQELSDRHGQLDGWVEKELGYKKGEIGKYLAAEQVDAVALALDNVQKNAAFIIGDQTGIGKGRVVASALRYAMRKGLVPVFVTEKPNLYGDIIRDLTDIGVPQMLGRDLKPFLTNAGESIPLDDEAVAWYDEAQRAKAEGQPAPQKRGKFLRASGGDLHKRQMAALQKDGTGKDFDIIFTTYDQLNTVKGATTDRRRLVDGLADRAFIVLDQSHNAGGTEASERAAKNGPESRSDFLKKVTTKAKAVMFSSATYAKRPGVMALYARTDMGKAVEKPEMLGELIGRGGVPMQQVVASMLAKAGQYIRRERSFDGVSYDVEPVAVDIKAYEAVSTALSSIARFDIDLKRGDIFREIKDNLKKDAEAMAMDSGTGEVSVSSTNFTSLMHNIVNQMLLAIKTDAVATRAIEALQAGEKPVITVANTMGAFLKSYAEENDVKRGDPVDLSFRDVLSRYLERTRRLTIKRPDNTTYHYTIPMSALPGVMQKAYRDAEKLIEAIDTSNLPISPIDWLHFRLAKAGYRVSEITGRKEILEYAGPDNASFSERLDSEVSPAGRRVNIDKFNRGDIDVMILNRAGSTGLSLHASSKFKDQRRRRMIIAQAELNIDVHMQMLGRVHRTGQVVPPAFVQAYADVPAEARPAAVLAKKMASLNANTTASRKSAFSADDSVDFLNDYGDQVAREYLSENPDINVLLEVSLDPEKETARELTGRLLLLPVAEQKRALDEITARYKVLIENLDAMGENALEAKTMDLGAKAISRQELKPAEGDSPFTQAVILEETEVKSQGKALPMPEILEKAAESLGAGKISAESPEAALNELLRTAEKLRPVFARKWLEDFDRMAADELKVTKNVDVRAKRAEAHAQNRARFETILDLVMPGRRVEVKAKDGAALVGIVTSVTRRGQTGTTGNPLALGAWSAEIAIPDNAQRITVPFSSMALPGDTVGESERKVHLAAPDWATTFQNTVQAFENARKTGKDTRYIVTGNILAGFDQTKGQGQIVNYTDDQGNVRPGILMPKTFSPKAFLSERAVRFKTAAQVTAFLKRLPAAEIVSHDEIIAVRTNDSTYEFDMPAARQSGGTYFLNPEVRQAAADRFTKIGSRMRFRTSSEGEAIIVLDSLMKAGAVFQTTDQQDVAEEIVHGRKPPQGGVAARRWGRPAARGAEARGIPAQRLNRFRFAISQKQTAELLHEIGQIAERVLGHSLAQVEVISTEAAWNSVFNENADAMFDPNTGLIYLSLQGSQDLRATLRHEAVHALRQAGVFTHQEWAVLSRMAKTRWIDQYDIRNRYAHYQSQFDISPAELEELLIEEAIADAMADHWQRPGAEDVISRIFARVKAFIEAVRNMLHGNGFKTAGQVLEGVEQGAMSRRVPWSGQGRGFLLVEKEQGGLASRRRLRPPRNATPGSFEAPHDERVSRALFDSTDRLLNRINRAGRAFGVTFRRKAQDREVDLLRTQHAIEDANGGTLVEPQNAYLAASLYPGRVAQRDHDLVEDVIEPLVAEIARRGLSLEEVNDFVMARHAIERNLEVGQLYRPGTSFHEAMTNPDIVGGSGLSENEAIAVLQGAVNAGKYADLEAVGDQIVALNRRTLASLLREGLITQDQYDAASSKYQYYVPLRGWEEVVDDSHPDSPKAGRRYDVRGREYEAALGRTTKADSPLAYSIMQARQAIIRIEKNRVGKRFLRLAQANPNPGFWEVNRRDMKRVIDDRTGLVRNVFDRGATQAENVYAVKVGGKAYHITIHHEGLLKAMKGIGAENMGDFVLFFHKINRFFAAVNTSLDPEFIFRNFLRDVQQAGIVLQEERARGITRRVIGSIPQAARGMNRMLQGDLSTPWARYAREFADAGGKIGFMDRNDIEAEKRNLDRLMKEAKAAWSGKAFQKVIEHTGERLSRWNDTVENTLRLATYVQLRRAGASPDRAAFVARELTVNFNRKGEWGPALNAFWLFFNASMQGAASLFMRMGRSKVIRRVAYGVIIEAFLMDMLNRMIGGDDDDDKNRYDKIPLEAKTKNHIFMLPKWMEDQYGTPYVKIPLPLGWNFFHVIGTQASSAVAGAVGPLEAMGNMAGAFADAFNPLGSGGLINELSPTITDPILDIATNKDFFGEDIVPKQFDETTPYAQRYNPNVSPLAKWLTDTLSNLTGGSPERGGAIDWSPEWVEHLADFAAGGLGRLFIRTNTTVSNLTSGEDVDPGKVPFVRTFVGRDSTFSDRDEFFQIRDAVHVTEKELKARVAEGDREAAAEVRRQHAREVKMLPLMDAAEKRLAKLRKDYKATKNALKMGEQTRQSRLEKISKEMDDIQLKVRTRWHRLEELTGQAAD